MPGSLHAPAIRVGLTELAAEFKRLETMRRHRTLSRDDREYHRAVFARLSEVLASGARHGCVGERQFLRVPLPMNLVMQRRQGAVRVVCRDFGGGGCAIVTDEQLAVGEDVWLHGALLDGGWQRLHCRASVVWSMAVWERKPAASAAAARYGLRFGLENVADREQVDALFYRLLALYFREPNVSDAV
jgi:hypothetical protein